MRSVLILTALLSLSACATSGSVYSDAKETYKPIQAGQSRLFIYRENSPIGWGVQPSTYLDGTKFRDSVPNSYTVRDIKPGKHAVTNEGEVTKRIDFTVAPKETKYVREEIGMGWAWGRIHLISVDADTALEEMKNLHEQTFTPEAK